MIKYYILIYIFIILYDLYIYYTCQITIKVIIFAKKHAKCKIIYKMQIYKVQPSRKKVTPQTEDQNYTDSFNPKNVLPSSCHHPPRRK